ncbi:hypothetical protein [Streptomyces sp. NPDC001880]
MNTEQNLEHDAEELHGIHRFLLIGKKTIFAYHLALYRQPPHAYQMIAKISLEAEVREAYLQDAAATQDRNVFYSQFCPDHFPLKGIPDGTVPSFKVQLERVVVRPDGSREFQKMLDGRQTTAACTPQDVRFFQELGQLEYPEYLTYLLFGKGDEVHLAHQLAKHPNWDEVITAKEPQGIDQTTMDKVPEVTIPSIRDAHGVLVTSPLTAGQRYEGMLNEIGATVSFKAGKQGWWNHTTLNT